MHFSKPPPSSYQHKRSHSLTLLTRKLDGVWYFLSGASESLITCFRQGLQRASRTCERDRRQLAPRPRWDPASRGQARQRAGACSAQLTCSDFLPGEGNLPLAGPRVPENHAGCGLDCGADQGGRSPRATAGKREASQHVPGQPGRTAAGAGPGKAAETQGERSLGFQRQGHQQGALGRLPGCGLDCQNAG